MKNILNSIAKLKGVHHACIYQENKELVSTFPQDQSDALQLSGEMIGQFFSALQAIEKSRDEMYFSVGEKYLIAYLMHDSCIALLLTDKKINFPLIHMGLKSAATKIKRMIATEEAEHLASISAAAAPASSPAPVVPTETELEPAMEQLTKILVDYLGPAAQFVFEDTVTLWKKKYVQSFDNLPHLVELLQLELDSDTEKNTFAQHAQTTIEKLTPESASNHE